MRLFYLLLLSTLSNLCLACTSLHYYSSIRLEFHPVAVFMSVVPLNNTGFLGFYRTRFDTYETGMVLLDKKLKLVMDFGTKIQRCEDPRSFMLDGDVYIVDNHMTNPRRWIHLHSGRETFAKPPQTVQGKNWSPFVFNHTLYFVFSVQPLCLLRCDVNTGNCWDISSCDGSKHNGQWRGGSNAYVLDNRVIGFGHITYTGEHHEPFFWSFPLTALESSESSSVTMHKLSDDFHGSRWKHAPGKLGLHDPSSIVQIGSSMYLMVTESDGSWFTDRQSYNLTWYRIDECTLRALR